MAEIYHVSLRASNLQYENEFIREATEAWARAEFIRQGGLSIQKEGWVKVDKEYVDDETFIHDHWLYCVEGPRG